MWHVRVASFTDCNEISYANNNISDDSLIVSFTSLYVRSCSDIHIKTQNGFCSHLARSSIYSMSMVVTDLINFISYLIPTPALLWPITKEHVTGTLKIQNTLWCTKSHYQGSMDPTFYSRYRYSHLVFGYKPVVSTNPIPLEKL